jgi:prepilin signal peptidase PulO-like enzyme (type II secretory pathway)
MNILLIFFVFIYGLILGSFLNCLVWRLYKEESLMNRSYCPKCHKKISWYDNIPLLSFALLRGRCRHCHKKISWQYPAVELISGLLFVAVFLHYFGWHIPTDTMIFSAIYLKSFWLTFLRDLLIVFIMMAVFIYDLRWLLISTNLIIVAAVLFLILDIFLGYNYFGVLTSLAIGISFFGLQFLITRGRGIGEGDIWLGGLMALMFPQPDKLLLAIFASYIIGATIGIILMIFKGKKMATKLPLGVFLAFGSIIALFFGEKLLGLFFGGF